MIKLFTKISFLGLFFLLIPLFATATFNVNPGLQIHFLYQSFGVGVYSDSEVPIILSRTTWESTADLRNLLNWYPSAFAEALADKEENKPPDYSSVERIIIHDMGCDVKHPGCNNNKIDSLTIIQNIYRYHAVTRGWGDIGYHYIIDYQGNIYEGRYGGNGVRGAHTYYDKKCNNFNVGSIGILLMGNYEKTEPAEIMYKSLIRLVVWLASANGLDPTELNHASEIWHSPANSSGCDLSQGGLISAYVGPIIVGHGDIEEGNSDPGLVDLKRIRKEAGTLYSKYKNYLYTTEESSDIYSIENGIKKKSDIKDPSSLVVLNKNQLDIFPNLAEDSYPDGTLVKSYSRERVYLIEQSKRRPIFSEQLFNLRKFNWSDVKLLSDRDLAKYSLAKPLAYPDGVLIKAEGPEVYLVENGARRHITSAFIFKENKFKWEDIIKVSQVELLAHPLGENLLFADGALLKEEKLPAVYLVKNQKRHWIKNLETFLALEYKWKNVITLSSSEISNYAVGSVIEAAEDLSKLDAVEVTEVAEVTSQLSDKSEGRAGDVKSIGEPNIRIGIYEVPTGESIKIRANGAYEVFKNSILLASKKTNETTVLPYSEADFYKFLPIEKGVIFEIIFYEDRPEWNPKLNDNLFRGTIEIKYSSKSKKLWVINELPLENYLKGVAEALNNDPIEYLKAFVVAARSYALFHIQNGGKIAGEIFHLKNWAFDQLYKGYGFEERAPNIVKAVEETMGLIATFNSESIRGVYSSDSGGLTKSACEVFKGEFCDNKDYAYLKGGVKDPEGTVHSKAAITASHGVGMSSAGARRLAEIGKSFEEILRYYYLGIEIEKLY